MNTPKHSFNTEQPHLETHVPVVSHEGIVPGYLREKVRLAMGQRIVQDAIEHRTINLTTFTPQETIYPDINKLDQPPQTD